MVFNVLGPVYTVILFGGVFRHFRFIQDAFMRTAENILHFFLLPGFIFWVIGCGKGTSMVSVNLLLAVLCAILAVFFLSCIHIKIYNISGPKAVFFSQSCYRLNPYIGIAIIYYTYGQAGLRDFCILIGCVVPLMDILTISTCYWMTEEKLSKKAVMWHIVRSIAKNPLFLAFLAAICTFRLNVPFPVYIEKFFRFAFPAAMPLALITIGGALTVKNLKYQFKLSLLSCLFKLVLLPVTGYLLLSIFDSMDGATAKNMMLLFSLPAMFTQNTVSWESSYAEKAAQQYNALSTLLALIPLTTVVLL